MEKIEFKKSLEKLKALLIFLLIFLLLLVPTVIYTVPKNLVLWIILIQTILMSLIAFKVISVKSKLSSL